MVPSTIRVDLLNVPLDTHHLLDYYFGVLGMEYGYVCIAHVHALIKDKVP